MANDLPDWLPLLQKPGEDVFGNRAAWDLKLKDRTPVRVERAGQGLSNQVFSVRVRGETYACKLFVADDQRRAQREWAALNTLAASVAAHTAPAPVAFAPDGPLSQPAIVTEWVERKPWLAPGESPDPGTLSRLVEALAAVHAAPPRAEYPLLPAWRMPASPAAYLDEIEGMAGAVADWAAAADPATVPEWAAQLPARWPVLTPAIAKALAARPAAAALQPHAGAALVRAEGGLDQVAAGAGGSTVFLDWQSSGAGDPAADLAGVRWAPRGAGFARAAWDEALAGYQPQPDDPGFAARLAFYLEMAPLWWAARSGQLLVEGIAQMQRRPVRAPARLYRQISDQLDVYLAALGLIEPPEHEKEDDD